MHISFPCGIRNNGLLPRFAALQINSSKPIQMQKNFLFWFFHSFSHLFFLSFFFFAFFRSFMIHFPPLQLFVSLLYLTLVPFRSILCSNLFTHWNHNVSKTSCLSFRFYFDIPLAMWHSKHTISNICNQNLLENQLTALHLFVFLLNLRIIHKFSIPRDKAKIWCQLFAQCTYEFIKNKYNHQRKKPTK